MINTVIFDMGGTLEDVQQDDASLLENGHKILEYLNRHGMGINCGIEEFSETIHKNNLRYKAFSDERMVELTPFEIWDRFRLQGFDIDRDKLRAISEKLSHIWEVTYYRRSLRPHAKELLSLLEQQGYHMGVISNTPSLVQVHYILREYCIADFFSYVGLSSLHGYKKPHRYVFDIAVTDMGTEASKCAYVGDTISRDVVGARQAGFGMTIRINSHLTKRSDSKMTADALDADYLITDLLEIPDVLKI